MEERVVGRADRNEGLTITPGDPGGERPVQPIPVKPKDPTKPSTEAPSGPATREDELTER
jgi:hypothetical protein